jgi:predicted ATPase
LLRYLVHRWAEAGTRVLVLLAVRTEDLALDRTLAQWLGSLERDVMTTHLRPECLATEDVVYLVGALSGREPATAPGADSTAVTAFGRWLASKTAGQPLYVVQTLRALHEQGMVGLRPTDGGAWALDVTRALTADPQQLESSLLAGVRGWVTAHLARLDDTAAALLAAGAALGGRFSAECLCQVAGVEERAGLLALDRLVRARTLREAPETDGYTFGNDLVRAVAYAEAGAARRQIYRRRVLAVQCGGVVPSSHAVVQTAPSRWRAPRWTPTRRWAARASAM